MAGRLTAVTINNPAIYGINRQQSGDVLPLEWAVEAQNLVINDVGKPASRNGFRWIDGAPAEAPVTMHEYIDGKGGNWLLFTTDTGAYLMDSGGTIQDVSGAAAVSGPWQFVNVNGGVYGMRPGFTPVWLENAGASFVQKPSTGDPNHVPSVSAHSPLAALGRTWCLDGMTLKYTDTLMVGAWDGVYDLTNVWPEGADRATGLAYFNGDLVIFGEDSIIVYQGNYDPTQLVLKETIGGIGCRFPRTISKIGHDLVFLSSTGLRTLSRTLQNGKMPTGDWAGAIIDWLTSVTAGADTQEVTGIYWAKKGYYLLSIPGSGRILCFHTRLRNPAELPPITEWTGDIGPVGVMQDRLFLSSKGKLAEYRLSGDSGPTGVEPVDLKIVLPWWGVEPGRTFSQRLKAPKNAFVTVSGFTESGVKLCWSFDYSDATVCQTAGMGDFDVAGYANPTVDPIPEEDWGDYVWYGESEYATILDTSVLKYRLSRRGFTMRLSIEASVRATGLVIESIEFQTKSGRLRQ